MKKVQQTKGTLIPQIVLTLRSLVLNVNFKGWCLSEKQFQYWISEPQLTDPIMVKNRWWRQIHLSDTQILETTGSHITIQHGATNNYRSRYRSWPTVVSEKTQNFCVFWTKIVAPFYIKILDPPFKIVFTYQHLITVVQIVVNKFTVYRYHSHVHYYYIYYFTIKYYTHQNM